VIEKWYSQTAAGEMADNFESDCIAVNAARKQGLLDIMVLEDIICTLRAARRICAVAAILEKTGTRSRIRHLQLDHRPR
jgi:wobble nucleotide-excising tRNase